MGNSTTWGERIKQRRQQLRMTKAELARQVGVKPPSVFAWESGDTKELDGANLLAAAKALKCNPEWIMGGEPSIAPSLPGASDLVAPAVRDSQVSNGEFVSSLLTKLSEILLTSDPSTKALIGDLLSRYANAEDRESMEATIVAIQALVEREGSTKRRRAPPAGPLPQVKFDADVELPANTKKRA